MLVACDIDGVIADVREEYHYLPDWNEYFKHLDEHKPIKSMVNLVKALALSGHSVVFVTSRPESTRRATALWLNKVLWTKEVLWSYQLRMREVGDARPSAEIKLEFCRELKPSLVFEDEPRASGLLADAGFTVLQVHGFRLDKDMDHIPVGY
jgi:uncharacterized HAD superfamily protein